MNNLQRIGGIAAISEAIIYISAFIFFGAYWHYPNDEDTINQLSYLAENQFAFTAINLLMYVLFGVLLSILNLSLYERLKGKNPILVQTATIFGIIWVGLVIASGMISNVGLSTVIKLSASDPERAMTIWITIKSVVEGVGGGNELVGGLWVLLLSIAAFKSNQFHKFLNFLGVFVGLVGILTIYPAEILTEIFGICQIFWFIWLGVAMLKSEKS